MRAAMNAKSALRLYGKLLTMLFLRVRAKFRGFQCASEVELPRVTMMSVWQPQTAYFGKAKQRSSHLFASSQSAVNLISDSELQSDRRLELHLEF